MIKHGKIYPVYGPHKQHLSPIMGYVTKGVADAAESITIHPEGSDVRKGKRYDAQQCVIAKCLSRELHPQAVAIGRSLAYAVFGGLAIRFKINHAARKAIEEFDERGRVVRAPITLSAVPLSQTLSVMRKRKSTSFKRSGEHRRLMKVNVRAVGGGIVMKVT